MHGKGATGVVPGLPRGDGDVVAVLGEVREVGEREVVQLVWLRDVAPATVGESQSVGVVNPTARSPAKVHRVLGAVKGMQERCGPLPGMPAMGGTLAG